MPRRYKVYNRSWTQHTDRRLLGKIAEHIVADWNDKTEGDRTASNYRQEIAVFPVSDRYDSESQLALAIKLTNHLNDVLAAQEKAVNDDALLQRIALPYKEPE
jgi:hypothetical protein